MSPLQSKEYAVTQIGRKYNRLTILSITKSHRKWATCVLAECECGNIQPYILYEIVSAHTKSCGCLKRDSFYAIITKHGKASHPIYNHWIAMKQRCYDINFEGYKNYGGRGIIVCDEWKNDFKCFYDWMVSNGWEKGLSVDRFPNNDGYYEPNNCRLATRKEQSRNMRTNVLITFNGKTMCIAEWSIETGISQRRIATRIKRGWSPIRAISEPVKLISNTVWHSN